MSYKCKRCGKTEESSIKAFAIGVGDVCHMCAFELSHPELMKLKKETDCITEEEKDNGEDQ